MAEFITGECPHCGQAIEYPSEGTGQTVPCPTCEQSFVLKPAPRPELKISPPPAATPLPEPKASPPIPTKPEPKISAPPAISQVSAPVVPSPARESAPISPALTKPSPKASAAPVHKAKNPPLSYVGRLDQACGEFAADRPFEKNPPTREQVARALALAKFRQTSQFEWPTHAELVVALKELFPEFKKR